MWSGLGPEPQCVLLCGKCTALESQKDISELCGYLIHKNKNFCWQNHLDRYWDLKVHSFRCSMRFRIFTWARFKTPTIKITIVISLIFGFQWKNSSNWTTPVQVLNWECLILSLISLSKERPPFKELKHIFILFFTCTMLRIQSQMFEFQKLF